MIHNVPTRDRLIVYGWVYQITLGSPLKCHRYSDFDDAVTDNTSIIEVIQLSQIGD